MARSPVLAAGGIVLRQEKTPLIAVVRLRKRDEWVLPKGKLDDGETPRAAAKREVLEETGHDVCVHEFLGTLVYPSGGRSKVVHYWRMAAGNKPTRELMQDVRAVDWLPLNAAVERLSRNYEQVFLANVGPIALKAASVADAAKRKAKQAQPDKRRTRRVTPPVAPTPAPEIPVVAAGVSAPAPEIVETAPMELPAFLPVTAPEVAQSIAEEPVTESMRDEFMQDEFLQDEFLPDEPMQDEPAAEVDETAEADALDDAAADTSADASESDAAESEVITELAEPGADDVAALGPAEADAGNPIGSLVQKMRHWLRRAA
jgi:8-oxo-dGTP diphosphatase